MIMLSQGKLAGVTPALPGAHKNPTLALHVLTFFLLTLLTLPRRRSQDGARRSRRLPSYDPTRLQPV
jgi:hypothetical protein